MMTAQHITSPSLRLSIAPMMDRTDRHFRYLVRLISKHVQLYTEMVTANALVRGRDPARLLAHDPLEHPVALQLGGSDPLLMAQAAVMGAAAGYDEINLNIGCPSDRVTTGRFGVCLMAEPNLVGDCIKAIQDALSRQSRLVPVTVKTRIGIDHHDSDAFLDDFVGHVSAAGCKTFIIHARKAWLTGLSPKENREIPPLRYERAYKLKRDFPQLTIVLNGGVKKLSDVADHLRYVDGVMIGRAAYETPFAMLSNADAQVFGQPRQIDIEANVASKYLDYLEHETPVGTRLSLMTRHAVGFFAGRPGSRAWRQALAQSSTAPSPHVAIQGLRTVIAKMNPSGTQIVGESLAA